MYFFNCFVYQVPDESACFKSKARVPCLLVMEVECSRTFTNGVPISDNEGLPDDIVRSGNLSDLSLNLRLALENCTTQSRTSVWAVADDRAASFLQSPDTYPSATATPDAPTSMMSSSADVDGSTATGRGQPTPSECVAAELSQPSLTRVTESGESWLQKKMRYAKTSAYRLSEGWDLSSVIVKSNDDVRQEVFAMQVTYACTHCTHVCTHCTHVHTHICTLVYIHVCAHVYTHVHTHVYTHTTPMSIHMPIHPYAHAYTCLHTCLYT